MKADYDVAIVGAGISGYMAAYELSQKSNLKILLIDQGKTIEKRVCPMKSKKVKCMKCDKCSIMKGFGGAGNFSDGKYNITTAEPLVLKYSVDGLLVAYLKDNMGNPVSNVNVSVKINNR